MFLYSSSAKHSQNLVPNSKMSQNNTTKASEPRFSKHELTQQSIQSSIIEPENSITSSISDKLYKNSQNCELWKITRRHKKKYLKLILIICSHTVSSSTCFLKKNYSKIVKVFLHVETNQYNRDSKFILCNPSLGSLEARKKKSHELELSE